MINLDSLRTRAEGLPEPENLFSGARLPENFELPDNILIFYHDFTNPSPNAHGRWTLVVPFDRMTYFLERTRVEMEPGELLLISPHTTRYLHPKSEGYRRFFITFELKNEQNWIPEGRVFHPGKREWELLSDFLSEKSRKSPETLSVDLFHLLNLLNFAECSAKEGPPLPLAVSKALKFIGENPNRTLSSVEIAEAAGVSESHLRSVFRKHTGIPPGHYAARQRLNAAKYRLLHTDSGIAEIADSCGFASVYVFSAFFKKNTGYPPLKYRGRFRK